MPYLSIVHKDFAYQSRQSHLTIKLKEIIPKQHV